MTDDDVLAERDFVVRAEALLAAHGPRVALHLRSRSITAHRLFDLAARLQRPNTVVLLNDRVDVALCTNVRGVQLPRASLPVHVARALLGRDRWIGYSAHELAEAREAEQAGADFVLVGAIYATASHPEQPARGVEFLRLVAHGVNAPVIAIGGVRAERCAECRRAGAHGIAVIRAVWASQDPVSAAAQLLAELEES